MNPVTQSWEQKVGWSVLGLLLFACLLVVRPFASALLWAAILSYATWPLYNRILGWFGGRRTAAALALALGMAALVLAPLAVVGVTLGSNVTQLTTATGKWLDAGIPAPPAWLGKVPAVGTTAVRAWESCRTDDGRMLGKVQNGVERAGAWLLATSLKLGGGLVDLALSMLVTFLLLRNGPVVAANLAAALNRIAGPRGQQLLMLAGNTVRGVVYGILGTALAQALVAGLGLLVAGVPGPGLLALLVFFVAVVPLGPFLVMLPAVLWLFHQGASGWGGFLLVWALGVSTMDNFVRPWLISQGSAMPFILILLGVLGGAMTFGLVGVFIGPPLLAVGHRVLAEWLRPVDPALATVPIPATSLL